MVGFFHFKRIFFHKSDPTPFPNDWMTRILGATPVHHLYIPNIDFIYTLHQVCLSAV